MVKVIELPEGLREVCSEEIWIPRDESPPIVENEGPQPTKEEEVKLKPRRKLDLGIPF